MFMLTDCGLTHITMASMSVQTEYQKQLGIDVAHNSLLHVVLLRGVT